MKKFFISVFLIIVTICCLTAQDCFVDLESLKGTYTGDCKNGKAHGKGKASGMDSYVGDFKNGLPDGRGTYTWSNNNVFEGRFVEGLKEGKGIMTYKREGTQDSVVDGFWKKDKYIGKSGLPWIIHSKPRIGSITVEYNAKGPDEITFNTFVTATGTARPADNFDIINGRYENIYTQTRSKLALITFTRVVFPFHIILKSGIDYTEIEFLVPGSYRVNTYGN